MKATIDGNLWESTSATAAINIDVLNITGRKGQEAIIISLLDTAERDYPIVPNSPDVAFLYDPQLGSGNLAKNQLFQPDDFVEITELNSDENYISGRFQSSVGVVTFDNGQFDTVQCDITDGVFNRIPLTRELPSTNDEFRADIDGSNFSYSLINGFLINAGGNSYYGLTASQSLTHFFNIQFNEDIEVGTYSSLSLAEQIQYRNNDVGYIWQFDSGTYNITENNRSRGILKGNLTNVTLFDVNSDKEVVITNCEFVIAK